MKKALISLFACLLLCGCDAGDSGITNVSSLTPPSEFSSGSRALYVPNSETERNTHGAVAVFPLDIGDIYGLRATEDGLLIFSGQEHTTLTLLAGDPLSVKASLSLEGYLSHQDPSLQIGSGTVSFFRKDTSETVVLSEALTALHTISSPAGLRGVPLYDGSAGVLYYCTDSAIIGWDLTEDLHRTLKELAYPSQELVGLHMDGSVLQCRITEGERTETLFLSAQTGKLLHAREGHIQLKDRDGWYYAQFSCGAAGALVFGEADAAPMMLTPTDLRSICWFLERRKGAVTCTSASEQPTLSYYDLNSGQMTAQLNLTKEQKPLAVEDSSDGAVFLLCFDPEFQQVCLYRWNVSQSAPAGPGSYTDLYRTKADPDLEGLEACRALAADIGQRHGIRVLVWEDAAAVGPWDYDLEPEHRVSILKESLRLLDRQLSNYPKKILEDTASHFSSLSVCLVRQLTGTAESGSLETATGIQFVSGTDAYIVLTAGNHSEHTLYHELYHVMETHLLGNTGALDRWDELNPTGFRYDYSYETNRTRDAGVYLQPSSRSFIDTYSMSYPKEDRARIMEYAMLPGNEALFCSPNMQRKLSVLCEGIREAYDLQDAADRFLWEQYLEQ